MSHASNDRASAYRELLKNNPALVESLPAKEQRIAERVAAGELIPFVANDEAVSEGAIWHLLEGWARYLRGEEPGVPIVTGGLGSEASPGVEVGTGEPEPRLTGNEAPTRRREESEH